MTCTSHEIMEFSVSELLESGSPYQIRLATDEDTIVRYAEIYREKGIDGLPPIAITINNAGTVIIVDGHHRVLAAQRSGLKTIKGAHQYCDGGVGSKANYILEAVRANAKHGLSLTRSDRMNAARLLLESFPHKSLRDIAAEVGLSKSTIANLKNEQKSLSKMDKPENPEPNEKSESDVHVNADGIPSVQCDTCGKVVSPDWADSEESDWMKVGKMRFCCQECREEFESKAQEEALETAGTKYLAAFGEDSDEEPEDDGEDCALDSESSCDEHKRCPFCGGEATVKNHGTMFLYIIQCGNSKCRIQPHTTWQETEAEAWEIWDTRAEQ